MMKVQRCGTAGSGLKSIQLGQHPDDRYVSLRRLPIEAVDRLRFLVILHVASADNQFTLRS
jgi:hypothetical protein